MADLFRTAIQLYGKHGTYAEALSPDRPGAENLDNTPLLKREKYLFDRIIDVYLIAPLVGFAYQRRADRDGGDITKSIFSETVIKETNRLNFNYELITILDKKSEPDINKRLNWAFRNDEDTIKEGMAVFDSYVRGGIEVLYEKLIGSANTVEDLADNLIDFVTEYKEKFLEQTPSLDNIDLENI